ncbi:glycosyltransferase family 1 protein [Silanimonas sp.]|uniref:glycosyltransferase family 4 protein n=1 Tax=Silanimonas sp. TaxID=1929290 RepID=UPI001BB95C53|nr:glycosyltransferase family 1 protein [Silanimonas sp.]MBS3895451.1 glycosyltransferase family 4 protein [Silanimonas sp.]
MKLAVDMQPCMTDSRDRGIGRYSLSLVEAMARQLGQGDALDLLLDGVDADRLSVARQTIRGRVATGRIVHHLYPTDEYCTEFVSEISACGSLLKSKLVSAIDSDVLLVCSAFECGGRFVSGYSQGAMPGIPRAVVAHDLIPMLFPDRYIPDGHPYTAWYRKRAQEFAGFDLYLANSESTKRDLIDVLGVQPERIAVIGAGLDSEFRAPGKVDRSGTADRLLALGITKPFVLTVGNADWRKNCIGAVEAFAGLPEDLRRSHQLVLTRVGDDVISALAGRYSNIADSVLVLGTVSDVVLKDLYRASTIFFFPSLYEGFGLPVIEAMAYGSAVLSSDRGALPEVAKTTSSLFNPDDTREASSILCRALVDSNFRRELVAGAQRHAFSFDWGKCARIAIDALRGLANHRVVDRATQVWLPSNEDVAIMASAVERLPGSDLEILRGALETVFLSGRRRVLVDISEVIRLGANTGIQRVVRNYCAGLLRLAAETRQFDVEPIHWTPDGIRYARNYCRDRFGVHLPGDDDLVDVRQYDLAFMVDSSWWSPERFASFHRDIQERSGEVVWMVYDLVPVQTPQYCDPGMPPAFRAWLDYVVATADGCICISRATEVDLLAYVADTNIARKRPLWSRHVHLGSDLESGASPAPDHAVIGLVERLQPGGYAVALSTVEPRKRYDTILRAFENLWRDGHRLSLVIVGKQGWNVEALANELRGHAEYGRRLHWLESASDGDVKALLASSRCLIQASALEGFGLAVVEAGSMGVPLLLSDIPVFREIAGGEAAYFEVGDAGALASILANCSVGEARIRPSTLISLTWAESTERLASALQLTTVVA